MTGVVSLLLIIITVFVSIKGFNNHFFVEKYEFKVDAIRLYRDYKRLVTSGFLHVSWMHLIFNMLSLFFFSGAIINSLGPIEFLVIYFASLIGGDLLSLWIYRNQGDYTSVGASGAVCGIIFASIALFPTVEIRMLFIPMSAWVYGILYVAFSIYGIRSKRDNIGHEAHLGGALIGMLIAIAMQPAALFQNYVYILIIVVPTIVFIYLIITRPHLLLVDNLFFKNHSDAYDIDHRYNQGRAFEQSEIDRILDKISKRGMGSLSTKEKQMLKDYSKK